LLFHTISFPSGTFKLSVGRFHRGLADLLHRPRLGRGVERLRHTLLGHVAGQITPHSFDVPHLVQIVDSSLTHAGDGSYRVRSSPLFANPNVKTPAFWLMEKMTAALEKIGYARHARRE
jgi:hypothetical protein